MNHKRRPNGRQCLVTRLHFVVPSASDRQTDRQTDKNAIAVSPSRSCAMPTKIVQSGSGVTGLLAAKSSGQVLLYYGLPME